MMAIPFRVDADLFDSRAAIIRLSFARLVLLSFKFGD